MIIVYLENDGYYCSLINIPLIFYVTVRIMLYFSEPYSIDVNSLNDCVKIINKKYCYAI